MRFSVRKRRLRANIILISVMFLFIVGYMFWLVEHHLKPTLLAIAQARTTIIATQIINDVINEKVSQGIDPKKLLLVTLDNRGRVVLIQPNTMEFNKLAAETTIQVQKELKKLSSEKIYIPIGQALGSQLLASLGPKVVITIIPVGTVEVNVVDKFEQAGINQTRHLVYLAATTEIKVVVPMVSKKISVNTKVPITEYVVVGEVPNTYVQMPFSRINESINDSISGKKDIQ